MTFGFIGPAYTGRARVVAAEQCINLYPERTETPEGKSPMSLIGTPGLSIFATVLGGVPNIRGLWQEPTTLRVFFVASNVFYELTSNGTVTNRGTLLEPAGLTAPVSMRSNGTQLVVASNGLGYVFVLATNGPLLQLNAANFPFVSQTQPGAGGFPAVGQFDYFDTLLIASQQNSNSFFMSIPGSATDWSALNFANKNAWPDNITGFGMNKRELWLMGPQRGEIWWNANDAGGVPFERLQGPTVEVGLEAQFTFQRFADGWGWLAANEMGPAQFYTSKGYESTRTSTHGVEFEWGKYTNRADAEGFVYEDGGHTFFVIWFPTGDQTWVVDKASGLWHQRAWWDPINGGYHAWLARNHVYAFGKHLVGDRQSGTIYQMSLDTFTDAGNPIRRLRSVSTFQERKVTMYRSLDIYAATGFADGVQGAGTEPLAYLRISDDGGLSFPGNYIEAPLGHIAEYGYRWQWRGLGRSRDRVYEWTCSEPMQISLVEAYSESYPGSGA